MRMIKEFFKDFYDEPKKGETGEMVVGLCAILSVFGVYILMFSLLPQA
jgi:hypothetical protein